MKKQQIEKRLEYLDLLDKHVDELNQRFSKGVMASAVSLLEEAQLFKAGYLKEMEECEKERVSLLEREKTTAERFDGLLREKENLEQEVDRLHDRNHLLQREISRESEMSCQEAVYADEMWRRYTECLGLRIITQRCAAGESCLKIEFTNIDAKNPSRKFYIVIKVLVDSNITVLECQPMISHGLKSAMLQLNVLPNDWHTFIVWLRNEFKKLV